MWSKTALCTRNSLDVLRFTFKIGNRRRLGGWWRQPDPDLGGVTEGKWKSVEGGAHRRWYRPLRTCPTPLSNAANIATRRHPPCCPTTTLAPSCLPFAESTCTHNRVEPSRPLIPYGSTHLLVTRTDGRFYFFHISTYDLIISIDLIWRNFFTYYLIFSPQIKDFIALTVQVFNYVTSIIDLDLSRFDSRYSIINLYFCFFHYKQNIKS